METPLATKTKAPPEVAIEDLGDRIAALVLGIVGGAPFLLSEAALAALEAALDELAKRDLRGLLVRSEHPTTFCAGADVDAMAGIDAAAADALVRRGQTLFSRLANFPFPSTALVHGSCLGGGFELALACGARTASDDPSTRLGLPEVKLGILPAWGGTTRLARLVGLPSAIGLVTAGRTLNALGALRAHLVDSVVPREHLVREGRALLDRLRRVEPLRPIRSGLLPRLLERTKTGRRLVERQARKRILAETRGRYPAPIAALRVLVESVALPIELAFDREREEVVELLKTPVHKNLLRLFRIGRESRRPPVYRMGRDAPPLREAAVIGGGVMGAGIAALLVRSGIAVRLIDPVPAALVRGRKLMEEELARLVQRKDLGRADATSRLAKATFSTSIDGLAAMDLVIEAVPEKRALKETVLKAAARGLGPDTILATNTSSFPIDELARSTGDPARFVGLHFFNPPSKMPLLEIVRGPRTAPRALAVGLRLAADTGKTPVLVGDGPGFVVNRILAPYLVEACRLADEGVPVTAIDAALRAFGFPMGPFRLMDEIGIDVLHDACAHMAERPGSEATGHRVLDALVNAGKLGKKSGEGFYRYDRRGRSNGIGRVAEKALAGAAGAAVPPADVIEDRLLGRMRDEARRVLAEGLVETPDDLDLASVYGLGYPAFRGGVHHDASTRHEEGGER